MVDNTGGGRAYYPRTTAVRGTRYVYYTHVRRYPYVVDMREKGIMVTHNSNTISNHRCFIYLYR